MTRNFLDESCKKCVFYNAEEGPLYCDFTLGTPVRCSILKKAIKNIKFKERL